MYVCVYSEKAPTPPPQSKRSGPSMTCPAVRSLHGHLDPSNLRLKLLASFSEGMAQATHKDQHNVHMPHVDY